MDQTIIETPDGGFTLAPVVGDEQSRKAPYKRDFVDDNNPLAYDFVIPDSAGNAYARELSDAVLQNYFDAVKDIAAHNKALQENRAAPDAETKALALMERQRALQLSVLTQSLAGWERRIPFGREALEKLSLTARAALVKKVVGGSSVGGAEDAPLPPGS